MEFLQKLAIEELGGVLVLVAQLVAYIAQMRGAGLRTAVLSNFSKELRELLKQHDLLRHFDQIAISGVFGAKFIEYLYGIPSGKSLITLRF